MQPGLQDLAKSPNEAWYQQYGEPEGVGALPVFLAGLGGGAGGFGRGGLGLGFHGTGGRGFARGVSAQTGASTWSSAACKTETRGEELGTLVDMMESAKAVN